VLRDVVELGMGCVDCQNHRLRRGVLQSLRRRVAIEKTTCQRMLIVGIFLVSRVCGRVEADLSERCGKSIWIRRGIQAVIVLDPDSCRNASTDALVARNLFGVVFC